MGATASCRRDRAHGCTLGPLALGGWLALWVSVLAVGLAPGARAGEPARTETVPWGPSSELEPETGLFAGSTPEPYRLALRQALLPGTAYGSCQLLTLPAQGSERVVFFRRAEDGSAIVVSRRLRAPLWPRLIAELERRANSASHDLGDDAQAAALRALGLDVDEVSAPLDASTATLLSNVCRDVLLRVRYPAPPPENSGRSSEVSYHAAHWIPGMFLSGTTSWPRSGSIAELFIGMEQALERYARAPTTQRTEQLALLLAFAEPLARRLARAGTPVR
jgi:hypothetical protein